jgi:hypothetical protein
MKTNFFLARRSSKCNHSPEENLPIDNHCRTRTLSNTNQQKSTAASNSRKTIDEFDNVYIVIHLGVKPSTEGTSSEVLIFRPGKTKILHRN